MKKLVVLLVALVASLSVVAAECVIVPRPVSFEPQKGKGFLVNVKANSVEIKLHKAKKQTLWIPIENSSAESFVEVAGSSLYSVPMSVRLATTKVESYMPLLLDENTTTIKFSECKPDIVEWERLKIGKNPNPKLEDYRQKIHFTPELGWINDPNGMVWHDGEWHLFFQYNPLGTRWGNMSWGHAVSRDLIRWKQLPAVMYPDTLGAIYSGSAVVDKDDTAGFGKNTMVAIYTTSYRDKKVKYQQQNIAYSYDNGRTFTKYEGNPVMPSRIRNFRDPKVFWHQPTSRWIMSLACGKAMEFYSSSNLKEWKFESRFGENYGCHFDVWECPDLIELPYKGGTKWVLLCSITKDAQHGSSVQYFVGDFDGHTFKCDTPESHTDWLNYGRDNYATVTWSNVPDGRTVAIAWHNNWNCCKDVQYPTVGYRGGMSLAYELELVEYESKAKLVMYPAREYDAYFRHKKLYSDLNIEGKRDLANLKRIDCAYRLSLDIAKMDNVCGVRLSNDEGEYVDICFDKRRREFRVDRRASGEVGFSSKFPSVSVAPMSASERQTLTIVVDRASVECFTDISAVSDLVFPTKQYNRIELYSLDGSAVVATAELSCGER